jgi:hypothetical protein
MNHYLLRNSVRYVVKGCRLDVDVSEDGVIALQTSVQILGTLLSVLSKYGILHSSPHRNEYASTYTVYVPSTY